MTLVNDLRHAGRCLHEWKPDGERRSATNTGTFRANHTAVYFHEVTRNCETKSEPAMLARRRTVSLAKSIENVRQKLLVYSLAGIRNTDFNDARALRHLHKNAPAVLRKLHRIRQQIPNHLLQTVCVTGDHRGRTIEQGLDPDSLRIGSWPYDVDCVLNHWHHFE